MPGASCKSLPLKAAVSFLADLLDDTWHLDGTQQQVSLPAKIHILPFHNFRTFISQILFGAAFKGPESKVGLIKAF